MMSAPMVRSVSMTLSGVNRCFEPSMCERKWHPSSRSLRQAASEKTWKPAAVGEHRPLPGREAVHAARLFDNLHAGTQVEVVGVGQNNLGVSLVAHIAVEEPLDGGGRTDGHENRRANHAVVGRELAGTGPRSGVPVLKGKLHAHTVPQK